MNIYSYELCSEGDGTKQVIVGDHPLDLRQAVQKALAAMSDEEITEPREDWFTVLLRNLCAQSGFKELEIAARIDAQEAYCVEHLKALRGDRSTASEDGQR